MTTTTVSPRASGAPPAADPGWDLAWGRWLARLATGRDPSRSASSTARLPGSHPAAQPDGLLDFEAFFREHEPAVSGFLYRITGDTQVACDLSQETFVRAWQRFDRIRAYERPGAWLIRVATNLALQHLRRGRHPVASAAPLEDWTPGDSDPGRGFALRDLVRETLLALPPKPRALLVLREVYGYTGQEAAGALGMSHEAAKVALWRARNQFRALYEQKDGRP